MRQGREPESEQQVCAGGMSLRKKKSGATCGSDADALLQNAAADAVQFLLDTMRNDGEKTELRIKCAGEVLDRACANDPNGGEAIEVVLNDFEGLSE